MEKTNIHVLWAANAIQAAAIEWWQSTVWAEPKPQNLKTSALKSEASQTEISGLSSETPSCSLLGIVRLKQRRMIKVDTCQEIYEGFKNYLGNWQGCVQKLVEKPAGLAYITHSTVTFIGCHVVQGPCVRCVAKLSGRRASCHLQQSSCQFKIPFS